MLYNCALNPLGAIVNVAYGELARDEKWLPDTCAYRLLAERKPLFDWHPLISGDPDSVHQADISVRDKVISEQYVHPDELPEHLVHWFD